MTATPPIVDRETWQKQIDTQRVREKAHTRDGTRLPRLAGGGRRRRRGPAHRHLPGAGRSSLRCGPAGGSACGTTHTPAVSMVFGTPADTGAVSL
jgi:hypothetical protein